MRPSKLTDPPKSQGIRIINSVGTLAASRPPVYRPQSSQGVQRIPVVKVSPSYGPAQPTSTGMPITAHPIAALQRHTIPTAATRVLQGKVAAPSRSASVQNGAPPVYRPQPGLGLQQMTAAQASAGQRSAVLAPAVAAPPVYKPGGLKAWVQRKGQAPAPPVYKPANTGAAQRALDGKGVPAVTVPTPPSDIPVAGNAVLQMQRDGAFLRAMGRQHDRQQRGEARRQEQQFRRQQGPRRPRWGNAGAQGQREGAGQEQARRDQEARDAEQALQERARQAEEARLEQTRREQARMERIRQEEARREQFRMEQARQAEQVRLEEQARLEALADFKSKKNHSDRVNFWATQNCAILFPEEGPRGLVRAASRKDGFDSALRSLTMEGMGKFLNWCGYAAERPSQQSLKEAASASSNSGVLNAVKGKAVGGLTKRVEFDAGVGARWHVHYGEHVKFGSRDDTRLNFGGRVGADILDALTDIVEDEPGLNMGDNIRSYAAVREWITAYVP